MTAISVEEFGGRLEQLSVEHDDLAQVISSGRRLMAELLSDAAWFHPVLEKLVGDRDYVKGQLNSIWPGEVALWRSSTGSASVLAYIWEAHGTDVIHDHGSWGIIGSLIGSFVERKFRRLDDGKQDGHAELEETSRQAVERDRPRSCSPLTAAFTRLTAPVTGSAYPSMPTGNPYAGGMYSSSTRTTER